MRLISVLLFLLILVPSRALATWSVIAVDLRTGRVVIASATCVNRGDDFLKGVQAVVVPGKGVAACQAAVDGTHANQMLVFGELQKGTHPARIIALLSEDGAWLEAVYMVDRGGRIPVERQPAHTGLGALTPLPRAAPRDARRSRAGGARAARSGG